MPLGKVALLYGACIVTFFALDLVWLTTMNSRFYQPLLGHLMAAQPKLGVAAGFYVLYVVGIVALAVVPGLREGSLVGALWRGALFGFLAYATYDLTNMATLKDWPWQVTAVDMVWGTSLNGIVAIAGYYAGRLLGI